MKGSSLVVVSSNESRERRVARQRRDPFGVDHPGTELSSFHIKWVGEEGSKQGGQIGDEEGVLREDEMERLGTTCFTPTKVRGLRRTAKSSRIGPDELELA